MMKINTLGWVFVFFFLFPDGLGGSAEAVGRPGLAHLASQVVVANSCRGKRVCLGGKLLFLFCTPVGFMGRAVNKR